MIIRAQIDGWPATFDTEDERQTIGEGGEAVVLKWSPPLSFTRQHGNGPFAVKLYFEETPEQKAAADQRQQKLRNIPRDLPENAITPVSLVTDAYGRVIGYVMPLLERVVPLIKLMDPQFRSKQGITLSQVLEVLKNLHTLVQAVHQAGVVIGDFNDKNVLLRRTGEVFLIDVDSAQWGRWPCLAATPEFTDPTLLDQSHNLRRGASYTQAHDWYSFAVMVYQLLTLSHPYRDGVHRPLRAAGQSRQVRQNFPERVTTRLSVFHPTVHLDDSLHPPASLPDELRRFMHRVFTEDYRVTPFPPSLLQLFPWMTCPQCRRQHGRTACPQCGALGVKPKVTQLGSHAVILAAAPQGGEPQYVYYDNRKRAYCRENGSVVLQHARTPELSPLVAGRRTVLCMGPSFAIVNGDVRNAQRHNTNQAYGQTTVAANSRHVYWVDDNHLVRDDSRRGIVTIGAVAPHLTSVWVGERFGLAMVQAGALTRVLTFDAAVKGFSQHNLVEFGTVVDAQCVISDRFAWLTISSRARTGVMTNRCYVFDSKAQLHASGQAPQSQNTWLGRMTPSALAVEDKLLVPVPDTGIVRVRIKHGALQQEGTYRGSAGLVPNAHATVGLCLTPDGLVHIGANGITTVN